MKHDRIAPHHTDTPIPHLSDEEVEARVFRRLEARQKAWDDDREGRIVILQYPDTRPVFQRLWAWWHRRFRHRNAAARLDDQVRVTEPSWQGHWASARYL